MTAPPIRCTRSSDESSGELFSDRQQLAAPLGAQFWISHLQRLELIHHDPRNNQARILLVVGRYDMPRGTAGAGRADAVLVGLHVLLPECPLRNIAFIEFPI